MKRCAIYARYSSDLQSATSIEDQSRVCRTYADRQGWTVVATFEDAALSGFGIEHRLGYQQLLAAALSPTKPFDVILVEDLPRLTRDMAEILRIYHRLRLKGIDLVGVSDGIATGTQGAKVHLAVKGLVNELYLDELRDKTHRGLSRRVLRGFSAGGRIFGYRTVPVPEEARPGKRTVTARFEIDEAEADVVRRVFRDYVAGRSMKTVASTLNAEGIPFPARNTKRGPARRGWALSTIQVMLRNENYRRGARMVGQTFTRKKRGRAYKYSSIAAGSRHRRAQPFAPTRPRTARTISRARCWRSSGTEPRRR